MSELKTSLTLNLQGNVSQQTERYSRAFERMSQRGQRHMKMLSRSVKVMGDGLDRLGNRYTSLITGAGLTLAAREVASLETRFTRLGIQANKSDSEMQKLKETIFDIAQEKEIRVDPGQITSAIESIVEKTGDLAFAEANIRNIGMAIQATGANGQSIGEILGEFQKMSLIDPSHVMETLDILNVQGKEGAFTLQNIAALGPRVITAYTASGRSGVQAMREMGAALQMIRMGTGSSEMAATAFEATMRTLADPKKIKLLERAGIAIYDPVAAANGKKSLRPINELMTEIIKRVDGDASKLGLIFDAEAQRAFNAAAAEFQRTGSLETLQKFMNVHADGTTTIKDSTRAAGTFDASLQNLYTAWQKFQDNQLTGPLQDAADALNSLEPGTIQNWLEVGKAIAIVAGSAIALRKAGQAYGWIKRIKSGASTGGIGGALAGAAGMGNAQPVYVVNMPGSGLGGTETTPGGKRRTRSGKGINAALGYKTRPPSVGSRINKVLAGSVATAGMGTTAMSVGAAGAAGFGVGTLLHKWYGVLDDTFDIGIQKKLANTLGKGGVHLAALLGSEEAQATLASVERTQALLKVEVDDKRTIVKSVEATGMDVDAGSSMVNP
ncbi:MAG: hypothetical protein ACRBB4_01415 [Neptuniibacter sp.]